MKKIVRNIVSMALAVSVMASVSSCSLFDKAGKFCLETGNEFIQAALEREIEDMADLCYDDEEALDILMPYASSVEQIDCLLDKATFKATKKDCSTKSGKGSIIYVITLPDYDAALDEDPEDVDEFVDLIDDMDDTVELEIELTFKLHKDTWYISNCDDFADDFYGELYDIDFPFESPLASQVEDVQWYFRDGGTESDPIYDVGTSVIDLEIWLPNSNGVYYTVEFQGRVIYTDTGLDAWVHDYEIGDDFEFTAGVYTITFYDSADRPIYSDTCVVQ